jgi:hypothetical protein
MTELDAEIAKDKRLLAHALKLPDTKQQRIDDPIFVVRLKATNADGIRALKAFLKAAWRRHGLKALSVVEEKSESERVRP